jgi:hypothetical protein
MLQSLGRAAPELADEAYLTTSFAPLVPNGPLESLRPKKEQV